MLNRIFFFLIGFGIIVIGFTNLLLYLNLFTIGYNFYEYVNFIIRRADCLLIIIGFIIIALTLYIPGGKNDELHL